MTNSRHKARLFCAAAVTYFVAGSALAEDGRGGDRSIAVFAGEATYTSFTESIFVPWKNDMRDLGMVGIAYNQRIGTVSDFVDNILPWNLGDHITLEGEAGLSARFGDESLGEAWLAAYLRYDDFFWNDVVFTTAAVSTGVSFLTEKSDFERSRDSEGRAAELLHYMGPKITFADPDDKNLELFVRYHHRSGVFGLFDGVVSGSTFIATGVRVRF